MTLSEKSAYLKGLMEGMKLSTETDEGKMIAAIVELLGDVTKTLGPEGAVRLSGSIKKNLRLSRRFFVS